MFHQNDLVRSSHINFPHTRPMLRLGWGFILGYYILYKICHEILSLGNYAHVNYLWADLLNSAEITSSNICGIIWHPVQIYVGWFAILSKYYVVFLHLNSHALKISLTHWGRATHISVSKLTIIGSDNGLSPGRCQAIIWTSAGILLIGPLGTNLNEILIEILTFSFKKMRLKVSSAKRRPFCLGLNVLTEAWNIMSV